MMAETRLFMNQDFGTIRAVCDENSDPWFVAKDVCNALGLGRQQDSTRYLDDDEKGQCLVDTPSGKQTMVVVSEPGLYALINKSRRPEAHAFRRWINHDVLPQIRRTGGYIPVSADDDEKAILSKAYIIAQRTLDQQKAIIGRQSSEIQEMRPKALFADAVAASDGTCLVGELAKMMTQAGFPIGQNRLFALLRKDGFLGKSGSNRNVPLQRYVEMGLFKIKETAVTHADGHVTLNRTPKVTGKGQRYFIGRYCQTDLLRGGESDEDPRREGDS